tara:strand:- start:56042 stop:56230 length:189 start_codon:yes stop_codon:yes gene_type:complete
MLKVNAAMVMNIADDNFVNQFFVSVIVFVVVVFVVFMIVFLLLVCVVVIIAISNTNTKRFSE